MACVAAAGVGNITTAFPYQSKGDGPAWDEVSVPRARGDEVAAFNLGSTVIMIFPPGVTLEPMSPGQEMRMGRIIATHNRSRTLDEA